MKAIRLSSHARERAAERGATEAEIAAVLAVAPWQPAERGRREAAQEFPLHGEWNGRPYTRKRVRVVFVEEPTGLVVVTVYVYYFSEEGTA